MESLSLDDDCKPTATPGLKALIDQLMEDQPSDVSELTGFRGTAARSNYLAANRIDLKFGAKEI